MTTEQLKKIVDSGDFCIQCPADYATNEKWRAFASFALNGKILSPIGNFLNWEFISPSCFSDLSNTSSTPELKTVLTLDQWWSVVHGEEKLYTIQDLADGKVACVNDGTVEELNNVFIETVMGDCNLSGDFTYYFIVDGNIFWANEFTKPNLPTQSVKDFVKQLEVKEWQPQPGEMVEVSDNSEDDDSWGVAKYHTMADGFYVTTNVDDIYPIGWRYCRPIQQPITPTIDELKQAYAKVHGVDVERIKIKES